MRFSLFVAKNIVTYSAYLYRFGTPRILVHGRFMKHLKNLAIPHEDGLTRDPRIEKFINIIMRHGEKGKAREVVTKALNLIQKQQVKEGIPPREVLLKALENARPYVKVSVVKLNRRRTKVMPKIIPETKRMQTSMQFFYKYTSQGSGASYRKLYQAIVSAFQYEGPIMEMREKMHKEAERCRTTVK
ncbi:small ribosomal subunit protein uS7-like isoform X2 [Zophobas morio]|uniref:small ribosomal subunit protein uS7-like isoform X2 n=1 Tax=Zophobas morio TaxID=2755281 RepID=UPI00308371CA